MQAQGGCLHDVTQLEKGEAGLQAQAFLTYRPCLPPALTAVLQGASARDARILRLQLRFCPRPAFVLLYFEFSVVDHCCMCVFSLLQRA